MGHTNINVAEHICSRCRRRYAIRDFPYPREVWWCRDCWRAFKAVQRERRRAQSAVALEIYFATPRRKGWSVEPNRSKGGIARLPPSQQRVAQDELNRLIVEWKGRGGRLTQQKIASLTGNAIYIAKYVRTGRVLGWMGRYWQRRRRWENLQAERNLAAFRRQPLTKRRKLLNLG